jgi:hypothetical protein
MYLSIYFFLNPLNMSVEYNVARMLKDVREVTERKRDLG